MPSELAWLIWLLPLASFAVINLRRMFSGKAGSDIIAIVAMLGSFILSVWALLTIVSGDIAALATSTFEWLSVGSVNINFGLFIDPLTAIMLVVVTVVALMVQIYSRGYMHGDQGILRYYAFLSLFVFAMLGLIMADNLLLLFMCWELVGLCSYLLIGFWFQRPAAAAAAKKAFLVTRIGDLGFLAALLVLYANAHTLDIGALQGLAVAGAIGSTAITWAAIGLFLGAMGKSAQFPLHIWLPDAMEGPTPVSALIHAATMVAAGVYLVGRMHPLFEAAPGVLTGVAIVGVITAIVAATMALVASDIKRVLAYSTISQLGYMMVGLALGGVSVGIFHLFNHAFFKALLFMGAGSISHAVNTFDMREMGGLCRKQPWTFALFLTGSLSLAGLWPLAGFFSKEEILGSALDSNPIFFALLLLAAFMTAFYIFRVVFLTFAGRYRGTSHPHESPAVMIIPMIILAILAIGSGYFNLNGGFDSFLGHGETHGVWEGIIGILTHPLAWWSLGAAGLGILLAFVFYGAKWLSADTSRRKLRWPHQVLTRKYGMDTLYEDILARSLFHRYVFCAFAWFDRNVIDGAVNELAKLGSDGGRIGRRATSGHLQLYSIVAILCIAVTLIVLLLVNI